LSRRLIHLKVALTMNARLDQRFALTHA
jgi:hypothetical protein